MLKSLHIKNYILIDQLDIDFHQGFTALTGETGAGKSILLSALKTLLGQRLGQKTIHKNSEQKIILEGTFHLKNKKIWENLCKSHELDFEEFTTIRRIISPEKKSRIFWNDAPISSQKTQEIASLLIDIHGQTDTIAAQSKNFAQKIIDTQIEDQSLLKNYTKKFTEYKHFKKSLEQKKEILEKLKEKEDFFLHQLSRFENLQISPEELKYITQKHDQINQSKENAKSWQESQMLLDQIFELLNTLQQNLKSSKKSLHDSSELGGDLEGVNLAQEHLENTYQEILNAQTEIPDEQEIQQIETQMQSYYGLLEAFRVQDPEALLQKQKEIQESLNQIQALSREISTDEKKCQSLHQETLKIAQEISQIRQKISPQFDQKIEKIIKNLGIPKGKFKTQITSKKEINPEGIDQIEFLFSANPELPPTPLSSTASGGETARIMLAIKSELPQKEINPTIIFDEIDTGVSGAIAEKMGNQMQKISQKNPLVSITHLPQVAALSDHHLSVKKSHKDEKTITSIQYLNPEEKTEHIAYMLSGNHITKEAIAQAKRMQKKL